MVGETKDVGWNIGVRRTVPRPLPEVWRFLVSPAGTAVWLGDGVDFSAGAARGDTYETADGTTGRVRSFHEERRIRLGWRPASWDHDTTLQITVTPAAGGTTIGFHQEWLADADERERQRAHWKRVADELEGAL